MKKMAAAVAVSLVVSASVARAQQSPLSGLFNSIKSLGQSIQSIVQPASPTASAPTAASLPALPTASAPTASSDSGLPKSPLIGILQLYAQTATDLHVACDPDYLQPSYSLIHSGEAQFKLGNFSVASSYLKSGAVGIAACAVGPNDVPALPPAAYPSGHYPRVPLDKAISQVGRALALSALAAQRANIVTSSDITDANNAMQLLLSDPQSNSAIINQLRTSGLVVTSSGSESGSAVITMTAADAVARYKANSFGFNSKYTGKRFQIRGQVQDISGSGSLAIITLLGYMPKNPQDQGYQDVVRCDVSDPTALQRVENLSKGQMISVIGLYNPATSAMPVGIELQKCSLAP